MLIHKDFIAGLLPKQIPCNGNDKNITKYYEKPIIWCLTVGHGTYYM